ncbi:type IV toxin-antitoxin system AbiEi family antitoxin domain-containing protein [Microbacterium sediminis]|uniref:Uncharacterized protein n=1 Tax=Microbacterium sediminis TaxID=904291 RepID=A0A1B9NB73_9MICO|nr:type IV toxin-antitoxin system AbiEi family antitoxin domain-containing protein [Microbacterium sediminis]OCG73861.1 hypothetical protein A7J15_06485 [Microbacterium sediminis]QBR74608.1 DUF559 domain-containing protein [Microbacterium sediminis]
MRNSEIVALLRARGGCARSSDLFAAGATKNDVRRSAAAGEIVMVRRGLYVLPGLPPTLRDAAHHGGALTCQSALRHRGVWVLDREGPPHVWLGAHGREHSHPGCRCVVHWRDGAPALGVLDVASALVHYYRCGGSEAFFVALESALRLGQIGPAQRAWIRHRLPRSARWLVDFAVPTSDSGLESLVRLRLRALGIETAAQVRIAGVGRVDLLIDGVIIIELDGEENHADPAKRHRDLRRDAAATARGYTPLRFDYALVVHDWPTVEAAILGALRTRGRRIGRDGDAPASEETPAGPVLPGASRR